MQMANGAHTVRRVLFFAFVSGAMAGVWADTASAQGSAEQAVAFMLWGLEPEASAGPPGKATWQVLSANGQRRVIRVSRHSQCGFRALVEKQFNSASPTYIAAYAFDFAAVRTYSAWPTNTAGLAISVLIEGSGWYDLSFVDPQNGQALQVIGKGDVHTFAAAGNSADHLHRAFADFRKNHCHEHGAQAQFLEGSDEQEVASHK